MLQKFTNITHLSTFHTRLNVICSIAIEFLALDIGHIQAIDHIFDMWWHHLPIEVILLPTYLFSYLAT
jgi:hypothetical protein